MNNSIRFLVTALIIKATLFSSNDCFAQSVGKKKKINKQTTQNTKSVDKKYYFKSGQLSVEIKAIDRLEEVIILHNRKGEKTYEITNSRKHGVQHNELSFYDNGAVSKINGRQMPDGGIRGYTYEIRFDENNNPMSKVVKVSPVRSTLDAMGTTYLWSDKNGDWVKQETIHCQPTPEK
jgi:hypothetical protein